MLPDRLLYPLVYVLRPEVMGAINEGSDAALEDNGEGGAPGLPASPPPRSPLGLFAQKIIVWHKLPGVLVDVCRSPVPAALALCCLPMVKVSMAGCGALAVGMAALMMPRR